MDPGRVVLPSGQLRVTEEPCTTFVAGRLLQSEREAFLFKAHGLSTKGVLRVAVNLTFEF